MTKLVPIFLLTLVCVHLKLAARDTDDTRMIDFQVSLSLVLAKQTPVFQTSNCSLTYIMAHRLER